MGTRLEEGRNSYAFVIVSHTTHTQVPRWEMWSTRMMYFGFIFVTIWSAVTFVLKMLLWVLLCTKCRQKGACFQLCNCLLEVVGSMHLQISKQGHTKLTLVHLQHNAPTHFVLDWTRNMFTPKWILVQGVSEDYVLNTGRQIANSWSGWLLKS